MAGLFMLIGVLGIVISVLVGFAYGSSGSEYGAAAALIYALAGILSILIFLAIGGVLSRLDAIVKNTAPATAPNNPAAPAKPFKWQARD